MNKIKGIVVGVAIALGVGTVGAEEAKVRGIALDTGNDLLSVLQLDSNNLSDSDSALVLHALGFITGIWVSHSGTTNCSPKEATRGQAMNIVRRFLEAHPEGRHYPAVNLVQIALSQTWPCTKV